MHAAAEDCRGVFAFDTSDCARKPCMILYASRDICFTHYLRRVRKSMSLDLVGTTRFCVS